MFKAYKNVFIAAILLSITASSVGLILTPRRALGARYTPLRSRKVERSEENSCNGEISAIKHISYTDNALERGALFGLSLALALMSKDRGNALKKVRPSYSSFVATSLSFMENRTPSEMKDKIVGLLSFVIPGFVKNLFRKKYTEIPQVVKENSVTWFEFNFLRFLVGPAVAKTPTSVELTECRYLREAGCKSACINLCKIPTQTFFNDVLNFPMTMTPDFEGGTSGCVFDFGVPPPALRDDPSLGGLCLSGCTTKTSVKPRAVNKQDQGCTEREMEGKSDSGSGKEMHILGPDSIVRCYED